MRKAGLLICICLALCLATGCGQAPTESLFPEDPLSQAAPERQSAPQGAEGLEVVAAEEAAGEAGGPPSPQVTVSDTVAYVFEGMEGPTLYGAAAYENTGNCPVVITGANLAFDIGGTAFEDEFLPALNEQAVVMPGETSFIAYWHSDGALTPGTAASMTASLQCAQAEAGRVTVIPRDIYLADNYPGFTTMTGSIMADAACSMNLIYTGFYDGAGELLGVWHFTKNVQLDPGEGKSFTVHMQALPIESLAERTTQVRAFGVGF